MKERFMTTAQRVAMHRVLTEVEFGRMEQHFKWGQQDRPDLPPEAYTPEHIAHDVAEAEQCRQDCEDAMKNGTLTYGHILQEEYMEALAERDPDAIRRELIQVAAVAVAWIEAIDRRTNGNA